jgi:hypothetical protein
LLRKADAVVAIVIPLPLALTVVLPGWAWALGAGWAGWLVPLGARPLPPEEASAAEVDNAPALAAREVATTAMARRLTVRLVPSYSVYAYEVS